MAQRGKAPTHVKQTVTRQRIANSHTTSHTTTHRKQSHDIAPIAPIAPISHATSHPSRPSSQTVTRHSTRHRTHLLLYTPSSMTSFQRTFMHTFQLFSFFKLINWEKFKTIITPTTHILLRYDSYNEIWLMYLRTHPSHDHPDLLCHFNYFLKKLIPSCLHSIPH